MARYQPVGGAAAHKGGSGSDFKGTILEDGSAPPPHSVSCLGLGATAAPLSSHSPSAVVIADSGQIVSQPIAAASFSTGLTVSNPIFSPLCLRPISQITPSGQVTLASVQAPGIPVLSRVTPTWQVMCLLLFSFALHLYLHYFLIVILNICNTTVIITVHFLRRVIYHLTMFRFIFIFI